MDGSLYIHIPFCRRKCIYCDFYSVPHADDRVASTYVDTLCRQINDLEQVFSTIFIGGGTPTVLDIMLLNKLLGGLKSHTTSSTEFTIEANPESLTDDKIKLFLDSGVNRLSIGIQSLNEKKLKKLGRIHSTAKALEAVQRAYKLGFSNIGIDLIFGTWTDTMADWKRELEEATTLPITHISCYSLTYERDTPLFLALKQGSVVPLDDTISGQMYDSTIELLSVRGFKQYEISNFAKEGFECRHNMNYWNNEPYTGLGASAVSYHDGIREENIADVTSYINRVADGEPVVVSSERLTAIKRAKETAAVKIRTREGIGFAWFKDKTGYDFLNLEKQAVSKLLEDDLIRYIRDKESITGVCLRRKGFLFCDTVSSALL